MNLTDFAKHLTDFLSSYLPSQKNLSQNSIKSYRDCFILLLRYCRDIRGIHAEHITVNFIDASLILSFLDYLEIERKCSIRSRNQRLSVLHSFFRYLQVECPERMMQCNQILAIPHKRHIRHSVNYLSTDEVRAILKQPGISTKSARRDTVILSLLYDSGARVQELIDLKVRDIRLDSPAQIQLKGKGNRIRVTPILDGTVHLLTEYMNEHRLDINICPDLYLFQNRKKESFSRSGIRYILKKYTDELTKTKHGTIKNVSPHTFRHSKAMHLLHSGNPLNIIQSILGHADIRSTDIYAKANIEMKRNALKKASIFEQQIILPAWKENKKLMHWLQSL